MTAKNRREADKKAELFSVLADSSRYLILQAISRENGANVQDICARVDMSQSAVSHQLHSMVDFGVAKATKDGRFVRYELTNTVLGNKVSRLLRIK